MPDPTVPLRGAGADRQRWRVYVGYLGGIASVGHFSAKVFAEHEAKNLRAQYPDPLVEFWVYNGNVRITRTWANIKPLLATVGIHKNIFGNSTKKSADRRVMGVVRNAIRKTLTGERVHPDVSCLPYSIKELMEYVSAQFRSGMSWSNWGSEWVIDHIEPRAAFDMRDPKQLMRCWSLSNLQPLWAYENNAKGTADKDFVRNAA